MKVSAVISTFANILLCSGIALAIMALPLHSLCYTVGGLLSSTSGLTLTFVGIWAHKVETKKKA